MNFTLHKTPTGYLAGGLPSGTVYRFDVTEDTKVRSLEDFAERYLAPIESCEKNIAAGKGKN